MRDMSKLIRSVVLGAVSGLVGTLCMDLLWFRRFRSEGGSQSFIPWESSEGLNAYEDAPAPARTAKVMAELAGVDLPDSSARVANNAVHWLTGMAWGEMHGAVAFVSGTSNPVLGLATAVTAWATSYVVLPRLGVYEPMSEYEWDVLRQDLTAHLMYGSALGLTFRVLSRGR